MFSSLLLWLRLPLGRHLPFSVEPSIEPFSGQAKNEALKLWHDTGRGKKRVSQWTRRIIHENRTPLAVVAPFVFFSCFFPLWFVSTSCYYLLLMLSATNEIIITTRILKKAEWHSNDWRKKKGRDAVHASRISRPLAVCLAGLRSLPLELCEEEPEISKRTLY